MKAEGEKIKHRRVSFVLFQGGHCNERVLFFVLFFCFQVQTLIEDVQKLQSTLNQLRESSARQLSHFEEELQVRSRRIQRLEAQLEEQKDYQEIRRELRCEAAWLKPIEYSYQTFIILQLFSSAHY